MYQVFAFTSKSLNKAFLSTHISFHGKSKQWIQDDMKTWKRGPVLKKELITLSNAYDFTVNKEFLVDDGDEYDRVISIFKSRGFKVLGRPQLIKSNVKL
ncbi:hypothetical protein [Photobacterium satsumensis]|uniref:hypothetical protein n=1 Tax=Photobacterium satsumensis TaxID=2910239 RepID=UPI003D0CE0F4